MKMLSNFIKGELPLWKSFWICGVLIGIPVAIFGLLEQFLILNNIIILTLYIFWTVGVWRSGRNYTGRKFWTFLSRLSSVLGTLGQFTILIELILLIP